MATANITVDLVGLDSVKGLAGFINRFAEEWLPKLPAADQEAARAAIDEALEPFRKPEGSGV